MKALILDFETLDTTPTAAVTTLSCIVFDPSERVSFDKLLNQGKTWKFNWKEQIKSSRTTSKSTIEFWKKTENKEAFNQCVKPNPDDISLKDFPNLFYNFLNDSGYDLSSNSTDHAYSRGNSFDFSLLDNIYDCAIEQKIIKYWNYRDVRTAIDSIAPYFDEHHKNNGYLNNFIDIPNFVKHNSLHDCARDIMLIQYAHYQLQKLF